MSIDRKIRILRRCRLRLAMMSPALEPRVEWRLARRLVLSAALLELIAVASYLASPASRQLLAVFLTFLTAVLLAFLWRAQNLLRRRTAYGLSPQASVEPPKAPVS